MERQWFDSLFDADAQFGYPNRRSTDIETVELWAKKQAELDMMPSTLADLLRGEEERQKAF